MEIQQQVISAWDNVRKMLSSRGAEIANTSIGDREVAALADEHSTFGVAVNPETVVVFHTALQPLKKTEVFEAAGDAKHIVLVVNTKSSGGSASTKLNNATVKSLEQEVGKRQSTLEIWTLKEAQYNVTDHRLVPGHFKLSESEVETVMQDLCVKNRALLPAISQSDPIARYMRLQPGDVVRIERPSPTAGRAIAYRCCRTA